MIPSPLDIETNIHTRQPVVVTVQLQPDGDPVLYRPTDPALVTLLQQPDRLWIGHNIAFDFVTLAQTIPALHDPIWQAYVDGRISDTMIREKLILCATGMLTDDISKESASLAAVLSRYFNQNLVKGESSWQLRFNELQDTPFDKWPQSAVSYCKQDVSMLTSLRQQQLERANHITPISIPEADGGNGFLNNELEQVRAALALQLMTWGGLYVDPEKVAVLEAAWTEEVRETQRKCAEFYRPPKATKLMWEEANTDKPQRDVGKLRKRVKQVREAANLPVHTTKRGAVKVDADTLFAVDDPTVQLMAEMAETNKLLTSFLPVLKSPPPLHPSYDILKATGRTSCREPNVQQLPRKNGVRECFIPRPGYTYIEADYSQIELCALAQVLLNLFGKSAMADAINSGKDLHVVTASVLLGRKYEDILPLIKSDKSVKEARQLSKAANFGFPGGMGAKKFVDYARIGYGLTLTGKQSADLKKAWLAAYPEMSRYFRLIGNRTEAGPISIKQMVSRRVRGMCGFCDGANTVFQGLAADGAKEALWQTAKEAYYVKESPLYGCVGGLFIHDEIILEAPEATAAEAADRLGVVMVESMRKYIPDVAVKAEPLLMKRIYKDAEPVRIDGKLVPWEPKKP